MKMTSVLGHEGMHFRDGRIILIRRGWRCWYVAVFVFGRWRRVWINQKAVI